MSENQIYEYLCINCPLGCHLTVEEDDANNIVDVRGWDCKRGEKYAQQEHTDPRRIVTTTVRVSGGLWAKLPVKSNETVPKGQVKDVCALLQQVNVEAPVTMGDVILPNNRKRNTNTKKE